MLMQRNKRSKAKITKRFGKNKQTDFAVECLGQLDNQMILTKY